MSKVVLNSCALHVQVNKSILLSVISAHSTNFYGSVLNVIGCTFARCKPGNVQACKGARFAE